MASIERRSNGRWRARYRDPRGRQHARHFAKKTDAERWLDSVRGDLVRGDYIDPARSRQTFGDYAREWRAAQVHRPTTAAQLETNLRRHILPTFEDRPLGAIRRSEVQAWVKGRSAHLAPSTVEVVFRWFGTIMRAAIDDGIIRSTPCRGVKLPKRERRQVVPLETEAVRALIEAVGPRYRAAVVLAAGAGLRQGEIFGLEVRHVDFLRRQVRVEQQLLTLGSGPPEIGPPKTEASMRVVPLPAVVIDELARHLAAYPVGRSGLIFTGPDGEPLRRSRFSERVWRPAARSVGLAPKVGMHSLRHYYASLLIRHGESVKVVQARLGHASASETLDTYSHLWPDSDDTTREAVQDVLGAASPGPDRAVDATS